MINLTAAEILFEKRSAAGIITLNRPEVYNALNLSMVNSMSNQLRIWSDDSFVKKVIILGQGQKAFCAGADIRALYEFGMSGQFDRSMHFWKKEYQLNDLIRHFSKPVIAIMNGIVMGGGFGLSGHCMYRIACDNYQFAMPEVGIGFFPDVGATYVLPRCPGYMGKYLAVTGARIGAGDAFAAGLVTHNVESKNVSNLVNALASDEEIECIMSRFSVPAKKADVTQQDLIISQAFKENSLNTIMARLEEFAGDGSGFARKTLEKMHKNTPLSMAVAVEQMQRGRKLDFRQALQLEYTIVSNMGRGINFNEGVKAAIINKNQEPQWTPARIEDINYNEVETCFTQKSDYELTFDDQN